MMWHQRINRTWKSALGMLAIGLCLTTAGTVLGSSVNYGDFDDIPPGVIMYLDVTETPNTQPPPNGGFLQPEVVVNKLDFDPKGFSAESVGGTPDITDVQLNFTAMTIPGAAMSSLLFRESGDFSLFGGTDLTKVIARLIVDIDILQVDGIDLDDSIEVKKSKTFEIDATTADPDDPFWSNDLLVEFGSVLTAHDVDFEFGVTKAEIAINDQLVAFSELNSIAFIAKKDFMVRPGIEIDPNNIPEPATLLLACFSLVAIVMGSYVTHESW